jgi:hypothetical protein
MGRRSTFFAMFHTSRTTPYKSSAIFAPIPTWLGGGEPAFRAYNTLAYTVVDQLLIILAVFLGVVEHFVQQSDMGGLRSNLTISNIVVFRELNIITSWSSLRTAVFKFDPKCEMRSSRTCPRSRRGARLECDTWHPSVVGE